MIKNSLIITIVFFVIINIGCKIPEKTTTQDLQPIPATYQLKKDSLNINSISRDVFFKNMELKKLIDTALLNNIDLKIAIQRIASARASVSMANGITKPSLDLIASTGVEKFGNYTMNGIGNYDMNLSPNVNKDQQIPRNMPDFFLGFRSSWEADIWGKLSSRKKAAALRLLASEKGRQWLSTQIIATVASFYYELLALYKEEEIILKNIELQENAVQVVKAQKEGGRATELAVQQFSAQLVGTKSYLYLIRQYIEQNQNSLNSITGKFNQPISKQTTIDEEALPSIIESGIPSQLLSNRPDLQEAELLLSASGADIEATRKAFLPSLNINAFTAINTFNPSFILSPQSLAYGLVGGLITPVLSKNMLKSNYELAKAAQQESYLIYQQKIINAFQEVQLNLKGIENYKEFLKYKTEETQFLKDAVVTSKELYLTGFASYLEVIVAQRGVLDAEIESVKSKKAIFLYIIDLYKSVGGGLN